MSRPLDRPYSALVPRLAAAAVVLLVLLAPGLAQAQATIKVSDDVNMRFGILLQGWADWAQDPVTEGYAQNLFLRRARIIVAGQVAKNVTFFAETDNPNLGKAPKALGSGFILQDGYLEWKIKDEFILDGGLILIPMSRNGLQSAASLLSIDYGTFSFLNSAPTQSSVGRDTGFQAKGYLAGKHLEYRVGVFEGFRNPAVAGKDAGSRNSFRSAGRLQYNVFDTEVGPFYTGTYLGKKKILAIGGGYDVQADYAAYAGDLFLDMPVAGGNGFTFQTDYIHYDGGATFTALSKQNDIYAEAGFYIAKAKVMAYYRFEHQGFSDTVNEVKNQSKNMIGLNWYPAGHNFNIKAAYVRLIPNNAIASSQFTLQLQLFYF